jgi:hypothetical protein
MKKSSLSAQKMKRTFCFERLVSFYLACPFLGAF